MIFVLDIGNTDAVVGAFDAEGRVQFTSRLPTARRSVAEIQMWLEWMCRQNRVSPPEVQKICAASVVPQVNEIWTQACQEFFGHKPWFLGWESASKIITIDVDRPAEVGPDRLANAIAVRGRNAVVIDFGTATTFDVVVAPSRYRGGIIAPGLHLAVESLGNRTALLPRLAVQPSEVIIGRNTVEAMTSGAYWGYVSMVEGLLRKLKEETGLELEVLATGGLSEMVCGGVKGETISIDPWLTLKGIFEAARLS